MAKAARVPPASPALPVPTLGGTPLPPVDTVFAAELEDRLSSTLQPGILLSGADEALLAQSGVQMPDARSVADQAIADAIVRQDSGGRHPHLSDEAVRRAEQPLRHPGAIPLGADPETIGRMLSPGRPDDVPEPLPPIQPYGTTGAVAAERVEIDPVFDRRYTIDRLVRHPNVAVRQRAAEAQAAIHHGSADSGILIRAAMDVARAAEGTR